MSSENTLWLEKYRPDTLDQVKGNELLINKLKVLSQQNHIPNLILTGPPGCGKTTSVLALCKEVLQNNFKNGTIELNASDDRGIDVVRNKIKQFAEKVVLLPEGQHKVIILDEADSLTSAAQQALRMIISDYSDSTRFIFSCNNSSKIIEPLQSRCSILRFNKLESSQILECLLDICQKEKVKYEKEGLETLLFISEGDMRNAINNLQAVWTSRGLVNKKNVFEVCDVPNTEVLFNMFEAITKGELNRALAIFEDLWNENYCTHDLINYLGRSLEKYKEFPYNLKFQLLKVSGELKLRDSLGLGTKTQILGSIAEMVEISRNSK